MNYSGKLVDDFYLLSNYLLVFALPFPKEIFNIAVAIWILSFLINKIIRKRSGINRVFRSSISVSFILIYALYIIGLGWSSDISAGTFMLERSLFYIIAPFFLVELTYLESEKFLKRISYSFILGCATILVGGIIITFVKTDLLASLFGGGNNSLDLWNSFKWNFTYQIFAQKIGSHAVYMSSFLVFAIFLAIENLKSEKSILLRKVLIACCILCLLFLYLFQSAVIIFVFALLTVLYFLFENRRASVFVKRVACSVNFLLLAFVFLLKANKELSSTPALLMILFAGMMGYILPSLFKIIGRIRIRPQYMVLLIVIVIGAIFMMLRLEKVQNYASNNPSNVSARIWTWKSATEIIESNFFFGVGTGDTGNELNKVYERIDFKPGILYNYNEHNQYLRFWMETGIFSLLVFLFLIYFLFRLFQKTRYFPILVLTLLLVFFSFTESELSRRSGITFFVYFSVLFSYLDYKLISKNSHV